MSMKRASLTEDASVQSLYSDASAHKVNSETAPAAGPTQAAAPMGALTPRVRIKATFELDIEDLQWLNDEKLRRRRVAGGRLTGADLSTLVREAIRMVYRPRS